MVDNRIDTHGIGEQFGIHGYSLRYRDGIKFKSMKLICWSVTRLQRLVSELEPRVEAADSRC